MKKLSFIIIASILSICSVMIISCNKNDDYEEVYCNLDVSNHTSLTRSSASDIEFGYGDNYSFNTVPQNESECMLWAMITIAKRNGIPIIVGNQNNEPIKKTISNAYTATDAYNYVKNLATSNKEWPICDVYGNPKENEGTQSYSGGAMPLSIAQSIAKTSGILEGGRIYFNSYEALQNHLNSSEWTSKHPNGTYIINQHNDESNGYGHASICNGLDSKGRLKYIDATHTSGRYTEEDGSTWTIIY